MVSPTHGRLWWIGANRRAGRSRFVWESDDPMSAALEVQANYHKMRADEGMLKDVPTLEETPISYLEVDRLLTKVERVAKKYKREGDLLEM